MPAQWSEELQSWLREHALREGFNLAGVAPIDAPSSPQAAVESERFSTWIDSGRAGEMDYLKRRRDDGLLLRSNVQAAIPWARSVIVCALNYNADAPRSIDPAREGTGWIARYAWSGRREDPTSSELAPTDYHNELLTRLRSIESALCERVPCETRCYVDTGPIVERSVAATAGIGWIGKNTCVINQQLGSWLLLGVIVTSLPVAPDVVALTAVDRCGSCTRCMDACPTNALIGPRQMDASRCIAYLTIEKKSSIPEDLRSPIGRQVFGCDICQDVCPWNRSAPITVKQGMEPRHELINPALEWLASLDAAGFRRYFAGSPLERTRRKRLHRNVAIAMGNSGDPRFLPRLEQWSTADDEVLAESARWAIAQIRSRAAASS